MDWAVSQGRAVYHLERGAVAWVRELCLGNSPKHYSEQIDIQALLLLLQRILMHLIVKKRERRPHDNLMVPSSTRRYQLSLELEASVFFRDVTTSGSI